MMLGSLVPQIWDDTRLVVEIERKENIKEIFKRENQFKKEEKDVRLRYKIVDGSRHLFSSYLDLKVKFLRECLY